MIRHALSLIVQLYASGYVLCFFNISFRKCSHIINKKRVYNAVVFLILHLSRALLVVFCFLMYYLVSRSLLLCCIFMLTDHLLNLGYIIFMGAVQQNKCVHLVQWVLFDILYFHSSSRAYYQSATPVSNSHPTTGNIILPTLNIQLCAYLSVSLMNVIIFLIS